MRYTCSVHAYVDESKRAGAYMMCAATIVAGDVATVRGQLNQIRPRGRSRIHMSSLGKNEIKPVISGVKKLPVYSYLYIAKTAGRSDRDARDEALAHVVDALNTAGVRRVLIESCEQDQDDRQVIHRQLGANSAMTYSHAPASSNEPLLWLPDIHAWAYGRGGTIRNAVQGQIHIIR